MGRDGHRAVVRREQVHVLVVLRELERDVGHDDTERQRLDADLLVGVLVVEFFSLGD